MDTHSSTSSNPSFDTIAIEDLSRRGFIASGVGCLALSFFQNPLRAMTLQSGEAPLPFQFSGIPISNHDNVCVPKGYVARVLYAWGDPINGQGPRFKPDGSNSVAEQELQAGMGHDGMQWFSQPGDDDSRSDRGLLVMNHEYTDQGLLFADGIAKMTADKVRKSQTAHGLSVISIEAKSKNGSWKVTPSKWSRRITANTPMHLTGPAVGSPHMKTAANPDGSTILGTFNNCASGQTPWGTYLACEENVHKYFGTTNKDFKPTPDQQRYGFSIDGGTSDGLSIYNWWSHDERFDLSKHPNEANRFGYVVELDPTDPTSTPRKHSALGRFKHENAEVTLSASGHVVVYMGDDEKNEYIYKFVSKDIYDGKPENRAKHLQLLEQGTLYVAHFISGGTGKWLPLIHGKNGLTEKNGFASQADIHIRTRQAADRVGATMMDRPEWVAVNPITKEVFVTLTNNSQRGKEEPSSNPIDGTAIAGKSKPAVDDANPRAKNDFGHILKWNETNFDPAATRFNWDHFLLAGDPEIDAQVSIRGDSFGSPDGLSFDPRGILWIQTDVSSSKISTGPYKNLGNNMMLAADPKTRTVRRFLTGPNGCEITGMAMTPDLKTMFVNIQHPGEPDSGVSDPKAPKAVSDWPEGPNGGRPRPATIVIQRSDGREIGA